jgi:hypothetical protein
LGSLMKCLAAGLYVEVPDMLMQEESRYLGAIRERVSAGERGKQIIRSTSAPTHLSFPAPPTGTTKHQHLMLLAAPPCSTEGSVFAPARRRSFHEPLQQLAGKGKPQAWRWGSERPRPVSSTTSATAGACSRDIPYPSPYLEYAV